MSNIMQIINTLETENLGRNISAFIKIQHWALFSAAAGHNVTVRTSGGRCDPVLSDEARSRTPE